MKKRRKNRTEFLVYFGLDGEVCKNKTYPSKLQAKKALLKSGVGEIKKERRKWQYSNGNWWNSWTIDQSYPSYILERKP